MSYNEECNLLRAMIADYQNQIDTNPKGKLWLIAQMADLQLELLTLEFTGREIPTCDVNQVCEKFLTERRSHG